jgi:hypothetical protein
VIDSEALPDATVGRELGAVALDQVLERFRAGLFLALHQELDVHRQVAVHLPVEIDAGKTGNEIPFVVGRPSRVEDAVPYLGFEGW